MLAIIHQAAHRHASFQNRKNCRCEETIDDGDMPGPRVGSVMFRGNQGSLYHLKYKCVARESKCHLFSRHAQSEGR